MLFNSYEFIFIFLPLTFFIYFFLTTKKLIIASKVFLVLSSLFFYGWWNVIYLPILLGSIIFNYIVGVKLSKNTGDKNKQLLIWGIVFNIALLGYFKYTDFFIENVNIFLEQEVPLIHLVLPLAISFFTFQQIAYLVDSYKCGTREYNFLNYAVFVSFFPQLIAGPIVHHKEMMSQFSEAKNQILNYNNIATGLFIFSIGLFKKVVIADTFAIWATHGFDVAESLSFFEAWATTLSYTFQIYFDFSGYSDMAIGIALLFNIRLPVNFNSPYKAVNIQDFWRRWHITLSRFLKDYVYIPLGGNRKIRLKTYANLMLTFLIGGIWHGAAWTFVFWGGLHGIALIIHRIWKNAGFRLNKILAWFITFIFINITWIFFRAKDWDDAIKVLKGIVGLNGIVLPEKLKYSLSFLKEFGVSFDDLSNLFELKKRLVITIISFIIIMMKNSQYYKEIFKPNFKFGIFYTLILIYSIFQINKLSEFLYFQF
ncbi:acetyltransferase [Candidatus Thiomargarita nelsonii]|uniref:Probable alginate O-acetylase n=1 Tax=Candidatus Thiomargarita nelsonii TaxID=1003181 RepID=A0A0A6P4K0_9GAMM|nr:acetyltransferase [Candidatus Thiomargarita nelsonii]